MVLNINAGAVNFDITNLSTNRIVMAFMSLAPSGVGSVAANRVVGNYDRAEELARLTEAGLIQVQLGNVVLKPDALRNLDAVTGVKGVFTDVGATGRPDAADVTDGTSIFNEDDDFDNVASGGVWYDPTGTPT
jgi:hypothetical protein